MGLINSGSKSNRLLASRRFTSVDLNTSQEAFASTIDIQASEVYTEANLIPTSSLPFSGSSSHLSQFSVNNHNIVKYYFRQRLTPSNIDSDVWFFLTPTGSADGVTPQLIDSGQQTNFISPKYSVVALANANAEDDTPGYGIRVFKSTSLNSGSLGGSDVVSSNDFQFDFKTGVLQFNENKPSSNEIVYMTAYQYVGTTLETGIQNTGTGSFSRIELTTNISGSSLSTASFGNLFVDGNISASGIVRADAFESRTGGQSIDFKDSINVTGNLTASGDLSLDDITATGNISGSITSTGSFGNITGDRLDLTGGYISLKNQGIQSQIRLYCEFNNAHYVALQAPAHANFGGNVTVTLPSTTTVLVGRDTTDTLTNKTLSSPTLTGTIAGNVSASLTSTGSFGIVQPSDDRFIGDLTEIIRVTVVSDGGNKYRFEGENVPNFVFEEGKTYRFDQSDSSNNNHPFRFSITPNGTHNGGSAYTTGVTIAGTPGNSGAYVEITVNKATVNHLYYYCTNHSNMGFSNSRNEYGLLQKNDFTNLHKLSGSLLSTSSFGKIISATDITATKFSGKFLGAVSQSTQIATEISGAFDKGFTYVGNISSSISGSLKSNLTEIINVMVVNEGAGNKYAFEGATAPDLSVEEGKTYRFEQSDSSNNNHPFRFSITENGTHGGGSAFSTNVTVVGTPGNANSYTEIKIDKNTPNHLYYYCTNHSAMGNDALILKTDLTNLHKISGSLISTASVGRIIAASDVTATKFDGKFLGAVSSSTQIATEISGAFTATSSSLSSRIQTNADKLNQNVKTDSDVVFSTIRTTGDIRADGDLIANQLIVSSSVTHLTQSFSSGSTIFGDSLDDTHQFTGSLQISGNIVLHSNQLISSSTQIATEVSGAFDKGFTYVGNISSSISGSLKSNLTEIINVIVVNEGAGNKYAFEGATAPDLSVEEGKTYRFEQSDSSNNNHPFRFSITENGSHAGGSAYTNNVISVGTPGQANSYTEIKIDKNTPNHLYYYCTNHSGMGNDALLLKTDLTNLHKISGSLLSSASFGNISGDRLDLSGGYISLKNEGIQSQIRLYCESNNAHYVALQAPAHSDFSGNVTVTLPSTTDTLVGKTTTDTLTNKTLTAPTINGVVGGTTTSQTITTLSSTTLKDFTSLSGSITSTGSFGFIQSITDITATKFSGKFLGAVSSSNQIATEISGAFTSTSQSLASRITTAESELGNTLVSSSNQIATEISGAFTSTSASLALSISNVTQSVTQSFSDGTATLISGSITSTGSLGNIQGDRLDLSGGYLSIKNKGIQSQVRLYCEFNNAHYVALQAPAHADFGGNVTITLPSTSDTLVGRATTDTLTNKTLSNPTLSGTIVGNVSASITSTGSFGALNIDGGHFTSASLASGGTSFDGTLVSGSFINKSDLSGSLNVISGSIISTGSFGNVRGNRLDLSGGYISVKNEGLQSQIRLYCEANNAHYVALQAPAHSDFAGNVTVTLPSTTDTLVGRTTTDTLTNKTLSDPLVTGTISGSITSTASFGTLFVEGAHFTSASLSHPGSAGSGFDGGLVSGSFINKSDLSGSLDIISGSITSTGSFGVINVEGATFTSASLASSGGGSSFDGTLVSGSFINKAEGTASFVQKSDLSGSTTVISGSITSTGSFGAISVGGGVFTSASLAAGGSGGTSFDGALVSGSFINKSDLSGSIDLISGSIQSSGSFAHLRILGQNFDLAVSQSAASFGFGGAGATVSTFGQFGFFGSGSALSNVDAGIMVQSGSTANVGSALYHDIDSERWSVAKSVNKNATTITPLEFVATAKIGSGAPEDSDKEYGQGEIYVDNDSGDIFIYA